MLVIGHFIDTLLITNVGQEETALGIIYLLFTIEHVDFELSVRPNEKGIYEPGYVYHVQLRKKGCPFCRKQGQWCEGLDVHRTDLFRLLVNYPSLRLHWLFLSHDE